MKSGLTVSQVDCLSVCRCVQCRSATSGGYLTTYSTSLVLVTFVDIRATAAMPPVYCVQRRRRDLSFVNHTPPNNSRRRRLLATIIKPPPVPSSRQPPSLRRTFPASSICRSPPTFTDLSSRSRPCRRRRPPIPLPVATLRHFRLRRLSRQSSRLRRRRRRLLGPVRRRC